MDSIYILIPIAVLLTILAVGMFFWAVNNEQYDDLDSEGERILFDDPIETELLAKQQDSLSNDKKVDNG